jgi:hypothetical protein
MAARAGRRNAPDAARADPRAPRSHAPGHDWAWPAVVAVFGRYGKVLEVKMKENYCFVEVCSPPLPRKERAIRHGGPPHSCLVLLCRVQFESVADAEHAIEKLDGYVRAC